AQMEHGLNEAQYGYWGFSPSSNPTGGYREYGVDAIGMDTDGYTSDARRTSVDYGFEGCSGRSSTSIPTADQYVTGVVTPHAAFMALEFDTEATMTNLSNLANDFDMVDAEYGFYDAVQVNNGRMARRFLALDQGMTMLALTNYLTDGQFRHYFADAIEPTVRPLLEMEVFGYAAT
ncbi:MAG: cellobiose phosphorylase, partial [Anaerolineae bacterium]|nr:cellobiose phosphorylase [Anaerolineae bacterium]